MPHSALGVLNVSFIAGDDVDMDMKDALSGGRPHIYADIVSIRIKLLVEAFFFFLNKTHAGSDFFCCQVEKTGDMPTRDDQGVSRTRRIGIASTESKFMLYRYPARILAKQARIVGVSFLFLCCFRRQPDTSFCTLYLDKLFC